MEWTYLCKATVKVEQAGISMRKPSVWTLVSMLSEGVYSPVSKSTSNCQLLYFSVDIVWALCGCRQTAVPDPIYIWLGGAMCSDHEGYVLRSWE